MSEISRIDTAALQLLASVREADRQEIEARATVIHEAAAVADTELTLLGQLGAEAVRLYQTLEDREAHLIGRKRSHKNWVRHYANGILQTRDGDISEDKALFWADSEIKRLEQEHRANNLAARFGIAQHVMQSSSYEYFSPPVHASEPEYVDGIPISQKWRVKASLPCSFNRFNRIVTTMHEFKQGPERQATLLHSVVLDINGDVLVRESFYEGSVITDESEQLFALGLITAAREAVYTHVPKKIAKKMVR
jgi:hypothetical protein